MRASVYNCNVIELKKIHNRAGNITSIHGLSEIPFDIQRVYYLYDVPGGEIRGGHAHYGLQQLIVAASGSFDVVIDDGHMKKTITLNRPNFGLYITPGIWRDLVNFSSGAVLLVLASNKYDEKDYIRDYDYFLNFSKRND
ncbi:FdtA/QdtA family cupin domain-containing protein [Mucilaginibacter sp. NFR10]|uniref:sugar 3,4-ketoisomerase n=1 Tax=Mucilaginibacter sp. NFR10 TaxID=1566292 RepID=UPI0008715826|nr:FdtA/QdtA family cupin domain-containing protein [Mucilaginibacter sp. NFR10]SCW58336.1 WxcM-like, C-terminal [Mucilaginibacter sp. NFR10]